MAYQPTQKGIAGKLIIAIVLAAFCGFIWALVETGTTPQKFFALLGGDGPEEPLPEPETGPEELPENPPDPEPAPVEPDPEPGPVEPVNPLPAEPAPAAVAPELLPLPRAQGLLKDLRRNLLRGLFVKADEQIRTTRTETLPDEFKQEYGDLAAKNKTYLALLRETRPGTNIKVPDVWRLRITGGGQFIVKKLKQRDGAWSFETVQGIRSRIDESRVSAIDDYNEYQAKAAINIELETLCNARGIDVTKDRTEGGIRYRFTPRSGRKIPAHVYFDLADFCARNGVSDRLPELFDAGLAADPDLLHTVHEIKGDRLVDVFIYFITTRLQQDAEFTYDLLKKKYSDTRAFREKVDRDVMDAYNTFFADGEPVADAAPSDPSPAPRNDTSSSSSGNGSTELESTPEDERDTTAPSERDGTPPPPPLKGGMTLPPGTPSEVLRHIGKANTHYETAMEHIQASNPNINPRGWAEENEKARKELQAAWEIYNLAQNEYKDSSRIPQVLLKRIREVTMMRSMCRKRALSH